MKGIAASAWESFERAAVPANASVTQRQDMRRAFYAGALATLNEIMRRTDDNDEPSDADVAALEAYYDELMQFGRDVAEGRA